MIAAAIEMITQQLQSLVRSLLAVVLTLMIGFRRSEKASDNFEDLCAKACVRRMPRYSVAPKFVVIDKLSPQSLSLPCSGRGPTRMICARSFSCVSCPHDSD